MASSKSSYKQQICSSTLSMGVYIMDNMMEITSWRVQQGVDGESGWTWQQSWKKDQALGEGGSWPQEGSNTVSLLQGGLNSKTWIPSHHFSAVSHHAYTNSSSINLGIIFSL